MKPKAEAIRDAIRSASFQAPEWVDDASFFVMSWRGERWFNFDWIADVITEREGVSRGVAERTLRELCATGDVRSIRYHTITDEEQEPERIRPNEWVKDQVDLEDKICILIFVSAGDLQYWLDKQATEAGRPLKELTLRGWFDELEQEPKAGPASVETRAAVFGLWPQKPPEALANPQIEKQVGEWITAYCKKNNITKPEIGRDTVLRAAGRRQ